MTKISRRPGQTQSRTIQEAPPAPRNGSNGIHLSPILYQREPGARLLNAAASDGANLRRNGSSGLVSVLSHRLPEPTSYSGRNIITLDFSPLDFGERPNQSQFLDFDGSSTYVDCGNPMQLQGGPGSALTIEAWVRVESLDGNYGHIVSHGQMFTNNYRAEVFLRLNSGKFEFGTWNGSAIFGAGGSDLSQVRSEDRRTWVHLAGVYNPEDSTYKLYRNGTLIDSKVWETAPLRIDRPWYIGAMWEEDPNYGRKMVRHFRGNIAEVRIWTVARSAKQIRDNMMNSLPASSPGELGAYWRLTDGTGAVARDGSGLECHAIIHGNARWGWDASPISGLSRLIRRQSHNEVEAAFKSAKTKGFFDPLVFPRISGVMTQQERRQAAEALKDLSFETFKEFYEKGYHLILKRRFSGATAYEFVPNPPPTAGPKLMLLEDYRLSSFLGSYGIGRTLKSFSLLPGERTKLTIKTASKTEETAKQSQSILDSYSQESASEFESSLAQERSNRSSNSESASFEASAEASCSWGFGSASASASAAGSCNSAREEFAKSVSNATSKHAAKASANRNVQIDTTTETKKTEEKQTEIVRDIENINVGRTLNFVFCQMNQEFISLLHLVDVRIGYTNGTDPVQEVPLYELPELLSRVMASDEARRSAHDRIISELKSIRDYEGRVRSEFLNPTGTPGAPASEAFSRHAVNRDLKSDFEDPATGTRITVPGIIVSTNNIVMRTEDVAVDAIIGSGSALDSYAEKLQKEEIRSKALANDRTALENRRTQIENERNLLLIELIRTGRADLVKLYSESLLPIPMDSALKRTVSIWEPK